MESKRFGVSSGHCSSPMAMLHAARKYLDAGEDSMARDLVVRHRNLPSRDPAVHRGWGEICHSLGMARQARESYGRALRERPGDAESLYLLAVLCTDTGHFEKAIELLRRALKHDPEHEKARGLLAENYGELGLCGQAKALAPDASSGPWSASGSPKPPTPLRFFPPSVSNRDTATILRLFSGREVGYAEQQIDPADGRTILVHHEAPLDHECVADHLRGSRTLACYPLRSDKTVRFAAILIRLPSGLLEANVKNRGYLAVLEERMKRCALLLSGFASRMGFPAYPEWTGDLRFRLFLFFDAFVHLLKARRLVSAFLDAAPKPESPILVEPLLATRPVGLGWIEQAVLLPLGVHRGTLKRSLFLGFEDGGPHPEQLKHLRRIRPFSPSSAILSLRALAAGGRTQAPATARKITSPAAKALIRRCPVLGQLTLRSLAGKLLRREEKLVLYHTFGLLDREGKELHELLAPCPDYDFDKVSRQVARLKPNPVSCLKMRELIPEITVSVACHCAFDLRGGKYPSPLLHVSPHLVPAAEQFAVPGDLPLKEAARRYVRLLQQRDEIDRAMGKLGVLIDARAKRAGFESVKVDAGRLRRVEDGGRTRWTLEVG
jgi:hypothetical protein